MVTHLDRPKSLAAEVVASLSDQIHKGGYAPGAQLPSETSLMKAFGVSRTVIREAISRLQASGLVETRHGIGSFVIGAGDRPFRIRQNQLQTLTEVVMLLELRIGIEVEASALAAVRRTAKHLKEMKNSLAAFDKAVREGVDSVQADFSFHLGIAQATQNAHFIKLMETLGAMAIPRARLQEGQVLNSQTIRYLKQVDAEHKKIYDAIENRDALGAARAMRQHLTKGLERRRLAAAALKELSGIK